MKITTINASKSLNKAYLKEKVGRNDIEKLKANLVRLLERVNTEESEENSKNIISDFLKETWYKENHEVNTKGRNDLVIHTGKSAKEPVGVLFEVKRPVNRLEMLTDSKSNVKALHELILYYLRERVDHQNIDLRFLVVTNIFEWFIFDEVWFEKNVFRNSKLRRDYDNWKASGNDTRFFYESIAQPFLESIDEILIGTKIDLREYYDPVKKIFAGDTKLIALFKIFSPVHLLKQPFANDSNSLDTKFYTELLHIVGLEEIKDGGKKLITQKKQADEASLIENTIRKLKDRDCLRSMTNASLFGADKDEQLFNIALELSITWINRVLFIKLLEAQLATYHKGDRQYLFLNSNFIFDFDELANLFFQVLAERPSNRYNHLKDKFKNVPYLNSSLFERTELERTTFDIGLLDNRLSLPLFERSILLKSDRRKKTKELPTLQYLLEFLNSYDFSSVGSEAIQEENKGLINASVLGLIFEKINGYKEGSFFTPGFVTMHMCKETIRQVIISKFNEAKGWKCGSIEEIYNKIEDKKEANEIINSIKVCDPAVGSGHFLVSALNEIICVKGELKVLVDGRGKMLRDYHFEVVNDELIVTDEEGLLFDYNPKSPESQRVQESLFHEKEIIIENCLFGVDINPNSVKICRLRLWIELLKHSYYTKESNYAELETLPNIDINIKCGDSLINRFNVKDDLRSAFKNIDYTIQDYKKAVHDYKTTNDREKKKEISDIISKIKEAFKDTLDESFKDKLAKARGKVINLESDINAKRQWEEKIPKELLVKFEKAKKAFEKVKVEKEEILSNVFYRNAFEWRFEFPEVLDNEGDFIGFDAIIGNPPYIPLEDFSEQHREYFRYKYEQFERKFETSVLFIVEAFTILRPGGILAYIAPVTWQTGENYSVFREYIFEEKGLMKLINLPFNIFPDAYVETAIYFLKNGVTDHYDIYSYNKKDSPSTLDNIEFTTIVNSLILKPKYKVILNPFVYKILNDLGNFISLGEITMSTQGLAGSSFKKIQKPDEEKHFPFLNKGNVYNYLLKVEDVYYTSLDDKPSLKKFYNADAKLLIRRIINRQDRLSVGYTEEKMVFKKDINPFLSTDKRFDIKFLLGLMASRLVSFIYLNISSIATKDDFRQTTLAELREIPIPIIDKEQQEPFIFISNCLLYLNGLDEKKQLNEYVPNSHLIQQFEEIMDAMVYELYLAAHFKKEDVRISKFVSQEIQDLKMTKKEIEKSIQVFYQKFRQKDNTVRNNLKLMDIRMAPLLMPIKQFSNAANK